MSDEPKGAIRLGSHACWRPTRSQRRAARERLRRHR